MVQGHAEARFGALSEMGESAPAKKLTEKIEETNLWNWFFSIISAGFGGWSVRFGLDKSSVFFRPAYP
jgi:hypothetical protein